MSRCLKTWLTLNDILTCLVLQVSESDAMRNVCHTDHILSGGVGGGLWQQTRTEFKRDMDTQRGRHTERESRARETVRRVSNPRCFSESSLSDMWSIWIFKKNISYVFTDCKTRWSCRLPFCWSVYSRQALLFQWVESLATEYISHIILNGRDKELFFVFFSGTDWNHRKQQQWGKYIC